MTKYEIGQELQICNVPEEFKAYGYNGLSVIVVALPGYDVKYPKAYSMRMRDGTTLPVVDEYLRTPPYGTPSGRAARNEVVSWETFDARTGLNSASFRGPLA